MTLFSAISPWLLVVVIAVIGGVVGIWVVRTIAPGILTAASEDGTDADAPSDDGLNAGTTVEGGDESVAAAAASGSGDGRSVHESNSGEGEAESAVDPALSVGETYGHDHEHPRPVSTVGATSAVERADVIEPVESETTPAAITTANLTAVTSKETRLDAVAGEEAPEEAGETEVETGIVCEYCGRDDFETAAQRNGHLRWCDEYSRTDATTGDDEEREAGNQSDHGTAEVAEATATTEATGRDGGNERFDPAAVEADAHSDSGGITAVDTAETVRGETVDEAADEVDAADEEIDVVATYAAVRQQLREELDISNRRTSREFYHVCRSRGLDEQRLAALERLTQAYEAVQYSDDPDVNVDEVRAVAAQFEMDVR